MFQQFYPAKSYHFNGDLTQVLPPRSASASSCKNLGPIFTDPAQFRTHSVQSLRPHSVPEPHPNEGNEIQSATHFKKPCFYPGLVHVEEPFENAYISRKDSAQNYTQDNDDLVISELLSITRPKEANSAASLFGLLGPASNEVASSFTGNDDNMWISHQMAQELTDLRKDITPRPFCGSTRKISTQFPGTYHFNKSHSGFNN